MTIPNGNQSGYDVATLQKIVAYYGSPDKVPDSVLQNLGIDRLTFNRAVTTGYDTPKPQQGGLWQDLGSMFGGIGDAASSGKHILDTIGGTRYPEPNPIVNGRITNASPNNPIVQQAQSGLSGDIKDTFSNPIGYNLTQAFVQDTMPNFAKDYVLPDASPYINLPYNGSISNAVPTTQGIAANKDDYAAQYGPNAAPQHQAIDPTDDYWSTVANGASDYTAPDTTGIGSELPAAPSYSDYIKNLVAPTLQDIPDAPAYTPIVAKDFTPQATKMAGEAYSPAFAAIDLGVSNAKQNYANSDAQIKGIYEDLGKALLANQAASDARFAGQKKQSQADTLAAQRQAAALNKAGGAVISTAAGANPEFGADLARSANSDTNSQINALAQTGLRNLGAQQTLQNAAANQQTSYSDAAQHQGAYTRQQLSFDLADLLTGYDQQRLNLTSDEKNRILDLANTLSNNDVNIQGQNQSNKMGAYQQAVAAIQARNANAQTGFQNQQNAADTSYKNDYGAWYDDAQMRMKAQEDATQNAQFLKAEADKLYTNAQDNQASILKAAAGSAASKEPNDPMGKFTYAVNNYFTDGQGNLNVEAARGLTNNIIDLWYSYQGQGQKPNAQAFQQKAYDLAQQWGIPPQTALAAASAFLYSGLATGYGSAASLSSGGN